MYPALAVAQSLNRLCADIDTPLETLWVGSVGGMEQALVERAGLKTESIAAAGIRGKNPVAALGSLWRLGRGFWQSRQIIRTYRPDVLFVTGGYVCVPVTLAARRTGVPVVIYLPDIEPGLAIKFLARFANRVAVTTPETQKFFKPGLTVVTGYPVRPELLAGAANESGKVTARRQLGLNDELPVLLVFGGSRGARSINQAVAGQIEAYLKVCQVVHISGQLDIDRVLARRDDLPPELQARYHVHAYLHQEMVSALLAADLVISRAGAGVMGEYPAVGLPSILVPLPIAGGHQWLNADYLVRHGAAVSIDNAEMQQRLKDMAVNLITNPEKLQAMGKAGKKLAKPDAAAHLAQEILEVKVHGN